MLRVGLTLSTYNRFDDVRFNSNLIKQLWPQDRSHDYVLFVCCNDPNGADQLEQMRRDGQIAGWTFAHDLPYDGEKRQLRRRQIDCWQTGIRFALEAGCDFAMHFHADASVLHPKWLDSHISLMSQQSFIASGRGYGLDHRGPKVPDGDVDDHFFIVSNEIPESFFALPNEVTTNLYSSEGYLANRIALLESSRYHHYDDLALNEHGRIPRAMHPFNYDPARYLLHTPDLACKRQFIERVYGNGTSLDL